VRTARGDGDSWAGGRELVILGWHNVESTWRYPARAGRGLGSITRQWRMLRRVTNVVPLDAALVALQEGRRLPARAVALTFDDGYRDNLALAAPVLRRLGLPATFFLVPGFLDRQVDPWWERVAFAFAKATATRREFEGIALNLDSPWSRTASLKEVEPALKARDDAARERAVAELVEVLAPAGRFRCEHLFMDWDEARSLIRPGLSIGSHTMRHAILARETEAYQVADLRESRARLQETRDVPVTSLAYPNGQDGDYDSTTMAAAAAAGYSSAMTTSGLINRSTTEPFAIRRRMVGPTDNVVRVVMGLVAGVQRERGERTRVTAQDRS
jgi:peptidoglycan/xylan/chitin deacetylase (PgdA/CDA1 family)